MTDSSGYYTWHVGELRSGLITTSVPVTQSSWSTVMDDTDSLSITAALADPAVRRRNLYVSAEPARCFLAVAYTDQQGTETFLAGGPIWSHSYDGSSKQLTVRAAGLRSLWDHRLVVPVLAPGANPATANTSYSGLSLGTIAKRLVQQAQTHTGGSVPVAFLDDQSGTATRTYHGYELNIVGQVLKDLTGVQGGPEIQLVPRRQAASPQHLEWVMRVGTTEQPLLTQVGADRVWDLAAVKSGASNLQVERDGSVLAERAWVQGAGTDVSTLIGIASDPTLIDAGFPLLESVDTSHAGDDGVRQRATVNAYAQANLTQSSKPLESWTFTAQRDGTPDVGSVQIGDWATLRIAGDYYLPDGSYRSRITSLSGDDSNQISVQLAPTRGGA